MDGIVSLALFFSIISVYRCSAPALNLRLSMRLELSDVIQIRAFQNPPRGSQRSRYIGRYRGVEACRVPVRAPPSSSPVAPLHSAPLSGVVENKEFCEHAKRQSRIFQRFQLQRQFMKLDSVSFTSLTMRLEALRPREFPTEFAVCGQLASPNLIPALNFH